MTHSYPYLPEGRTIEYVPISDLFMNEAKKARDELSTELQHSTGAVVVLNGHIVGKAGNQAGFKNNKLQSLHREGYCMRRFFGIPSGKKYWLCPGCASHKNHAEAGAVRDAQRNNGANISGADLYLYGHWWCCKPCWDSMIKAGINRVFLVEGADELFKRKS